jgi:hypothetical protein
MHAEHYNNGSTKLGVQGPAARPLAQGTGARSPRIRLKTSQYREERDRVGPEMD